MKKSRFTEEQIIAILRQLRLSEKPLTCREIADAIIDVNGIDARDRRLRKEIGDRVSKSLHVQISKTVLVSHKNNSGNFEWKIASKIDSTKRVNSSAFE